MSPEDVWTGSIRATDKGGALVGSVSTSDRTSCTLPEGASCSDNKCNVTVPFSGTDIYSDVAPEEHLRRLYRSYRNGRGNRHHRTKWRIAY